MRQLAAPPGGGRPRPRPRRWLGLALLLLQGVRSYHRPLVQYDRVLLPTLGWVPPDTLSARGAATSIGDVDGNWANDLVVGSSSAWAWGACVLFLEHPSSMALSLIRHITCISPTEPNFPGGRPGFGHSVAALGDLDDDGVPDVAVSSADESSPAFADIIFLARTGEPKPSRPPRALSVSADLSSLGQLPHLAQLASVGDVDGDGRVELLASGQRPDGMSAVVLLFLDAGGAVQRAHELSASAPVAALARPWDRLGWAAARLGDIDGDGASEVLVCAPHAWDARGALNTGAALVLFLNATAQPGADAVLRASAITARNVLGNDGMTSGTRFCSSAVGAGDFDADGVPDVFVGSPDAHSGGVGRVDVVLLSAPDGAARRSARLSSAAAGAHQLPSDSGSESRIANASHLGTVMTSLGAVPTSAAEGAAPVLDLVVGGPRLYYASLLAGAIPVASPPSPPPQIFDAPPADGPIVYCVSRRRLSLLPGGAGAEEERGRRLCAPPPRPDPLWIVLALLPCFCCIWLLLQSIMLGIIAGVTQLTPPGRPRHLDVLLTPATAVQRPRGVSALARMLSPRALRDRRAGAANQPPPDAASPPGLASPRDADAAAQVAPPSPRGPQLLVVLHPGSGQPSIVVDDMRGADDAVTCVEPAAEEP